MLSSCLLHVCAPTPLLCVCLYSLHRSDWTVKEAIDSLIRKSGFNGAITSAVRDSIELTRYQSSKAGISYKDYLTLRGYSTHPV